MLENFFNSIFGWAISMSPLTGLTVVAFVMVLLSTIVYKLMTDQELLKSIKEEMKEIRKDIKLASQDPEKMAELNKRSMEKSMTQMKHTMKPTLVTMLPLLLVFTWLRSAYAETGAVLFGLSWLWSYIILSLVFSLSLRKLMKVH